MIISNYKTADSQTHADVYNITRQQNFLPGFRIDLAVLPEMFCCPYENKYFPEYAEIEGGDTGKMLQAGGRTRNLSHVEVCRREMKPAIFITLPCF